jgi:uncharacterized metal-binding protein
MPNGSTHDIITAVATPVVAWTTYHFTHDWKTTSIIVGLFLFSSLMFNGDLDIESRPYNRWWLLKFIWMPYQGIFHHRSIFTHGLVIGTVVRILYLGIIPFTILLIKGSTGVVAHAFTNPMTLHMAILIFIGLELGAALHTIADYTL